MLSIRSPKANCMKSPLAIFGVGLVLRLGTVGYLARVMPNMLTWGINESGGIARWIVTNHTFSSPFHDANGPTAWIAPLYPGIVALIFLVFGVQAPVSAFAVMCFNSFCSAATGVVVYQMGREIHSEKAGLFAGWMWALSPHVAILPYILWDTALSALLLSVALLLTIRLGSSNDFVNWTSCGLIWGVAALVNPSLLSPLPALAIWLLIRGKKLKSVLSLAIVTLAVVSPWTIRNYTAFHRILPIRSNGLTEVYFANVGFETHPLGKSMEYQKLGEAAFTAQAGRGAVEYIRSHPGTFVSDSTRRAIWFWVYPLSFLPLSVAIDLCAIAGLIIVFRTSTEAAVPLFMVLAIYPLIYYASQVVSRYRHPIDAVLYVLSGAALSRIVSWGKFRLRDGQLVVKQPRVQTH